MRTIHVRPRILVIMGTVSMFTMLVIMKINSGPGSRQIVSQMRPQTLKSGEQNLNNPYDFDDIHDAHVVRQDSIDRQRNALLNEISDARGNVIDQNRQRPPANSFDIRRAGEANEIARDKFLPHSDGSYPMLRNNVLVPEARIVHLDLKGAQPKIEYLLEVLKTIKNLGATGVLIEWEDTFPYDGELDTVRSGTAYSKEQVRTILRTLTDLHLDIIPLVQTFGHLEWILKFEKFAKYRQEAKYPQQVLCMADEEAVGLVEMAVQQVLTIHKDFPMPFFHMGADEAFQVGRCEKDREYMREHNSNPERLMLGHIARIAEFIAAKVNGTRVLMWHDMLNNVDRQTINEFKLGQYIEPVVWNYAENLDNQFYPDFWAGFGRNFDYIWAASAYKGADGPDRYYSNVAHYLENHKSWQQHMTYAYKDFRKFRGIILTGWQRFDHFALLAEILPVGLPSLALNLQVLQAGIYNSEVAQGAATLLDCSTGFNYNFELSGCRAFPGFPIYDAITQLKATLECITDLEQDYQYRGWLSLFNRKHNYSQAWYLDNLLNKVEPCNSMVDSIANSIRASMSKVFFADTVDEFIFEYVEPHTSKLQSILEDLKRLSDLRQFPTRPFNIELQSQIEQRRRDADRKALSKDQNQKILEQGENKKHLSGS